MSQEETDSIAEERPGGTAPPTPPTPADLQRVRLHSGYGIAGMVFGFAGILLKEVLFPAFIGVVAWLLHNRVRSSDWLEVFTIGVPFCTVWIIAIPGLILSIAGLFQKRRRRETALVGLALNANFVLAAGIDLYLHG
jgi:hypothetical protein